MITKGIIIDRIVNSNKYLVDIPYFGEPGETTRTYFESTLNSIPGIYESYKKGDIVYISFEDHQMSKPVIIGKLYLGLQNNSVGHLIGDSLNVFNSVNLPKDTTIGGVHFNKIVDLLRKENNIEDKLNNVDSTFINAPNTDIDATTHKNNFLRVEQQDVTKNRLYSPIASGKLEDFKHIFNEQKAHGESSMDYLIDELNLNNNYFIGGTSYLARPYYYEELFTWWNLKSKDPVISFDLNQSKNVSGVCFRVSNGVNIATGGPNKDKIASTYAEEDFNFKVYLHSGEVYSSRYHLDEVKVGSSIEDLVYIKLEYINYNSTIDRIEITPVNTASTVALNFYTLELIFKDSSSSPNSYKWEKIILDRDLAPVKTDLSRITRNLGDIQIHNKEYLPEASIDYISTIAKLKGMYYECKPSSTSGGDIDATFADFSGSSEISAQDITLKFNNMLVCSDIYKAFNDYGDLKLGSSKSSGYFKVNLAQGIDPISKFEISVSRYNTRASGLEIVYSLDGINEKSIQLEVPQEGLHYKLDLSNFRIDQKGYIKISSFKPSGGDNRLLINEILVSFGDVFYTWSKVSNIHANLITIGNESTTSITKYVDIDEDCKFALICGLSIQGVFTNYTISIGEGSIASSFNPKFSCSDKLPVIGYFHIGNRYFLTPISNIVGNSTEKEGNKLLFEVTSPDFSSSSIEFLVLEIF